MRYFSNRVIPLFFLFVLLFPFSAQADNDAFSVEIKGEKAEVTLLEGKVDLIKKGMIEARPLALGDYVTNGDRICTKKSSRIELKLPDNSLIRFDELTTFEIVSVEFDRKTKQRDINVSMVLGKTWANVSKIFGKKGRFEVSTKTAVAGVRGTVYRVNVAEDDTVQVKVYWGEVGVSSAPKQDAASQSPQIVKPTKVLGPHPVAGPHVVSMEEWTYIVKSMQQIIIQPDGTATKPMPFMAIEDLNDWVRWNQKLDKKK
ncbi:MAG: FecR domain-containing protein [Deltaproteobacteria bacterium]|nr:FecR domain-containing protein [Deltaproteobacteria bacterium]MBW2661673.1 FecR domain-containing protein [Deltaproteobacteria bacterium]